MSDISDGHTLRKYSGSILLGFGVLALVAALVFLFVELKEMSDGVIGASLPLLAIGGVILLVLLLTAVTMIFSILGLANKDQAMGLPDGSIRAVIALSLIVLFAILSVFLYKGVSSGGKINLIANLSDTERKQFIREHATLRDIQSVISKDKDGQQLVAKDKDGKPLTNEDGTPQYFYDVSYTSSNAASEDFAKQLLTLLGTLMTAISSFYLGAGTATSATAAQIGRNKTPTNSVPDQPSPNSSANRLAGRTDGATNTAATGKTRETTSQTAPSDTSATDKQSLDAKMENRPLQRNDADTSSSNPGNETGGPA